MSTVTKPIILDETGQDLVAEAQNIVLKLQGLINAVKPTAAEIPLAPITGMTADDVQEGVAELKSNLSELGSAQSKIFKNAQTIVFNLKNAPSGDNVAQALMFNANQGMCAIVRMDSALSVTNILGSMGWTISNSGSTITLTPSTRLWGATSVIVDEIN